MPNTNSDYLSKAKNWAENTAFDKNSRQEIIDLLEKNDEKEIEERFYKDLEFGTGGMRAVLGQGTNRLNKYNIRKAAHAVSLAVLESKPSEPKAAISYDSRHFSFEFAKEAASVFAANGIKALIYKRLNPVALVSFAIRHHNCSAGVMVTASHNPPEYNGFKVFWADGAQVTPPNDQNIISNFNGISDYGTIPYLEFDKGVENGLIEWIGEETENAYYNTILENSLGRDLCKKDGDHLKIVYTALHGTGLYPCTRALNDLGLTNLLTVKEQDQPDGSFPTVSSPNPENAEALAMAVELMNKEKADLALGTDPDTDRVGVAFNHEGETIYLNGNQIGLLMLHYILTQHKKKGSMPKNPYYVKTIVTTDLQAKVAQSFGVDVENTLTGFKWICGKMKQIEETQPERNFVFATEESFGYLNHNKVRDKDGVASIALLCEIALYYKVQGKNLAQALDDIYEEYGFANETLVSLNYYGKEGADKINRIMENFRQFSEKSICSQEIESLTDYKNSTNKSFINEEIKPIDFIKSNVLGFNFKNGNKLFLRPSGTEPKIKFYIMIQEAEGSLEEKKKKAHELASQIVSFVKEESEQA